MLMFINLKPKPATVLKRKQLPFFLFLLFFRVLKGDKHHPLHITGRGGLFVWHVCYSQDMSRRIPPFWCGVWGMVLGCKYRTSVGCLGIKTIFTWQAKCPIFKAIVAVLRGNSCLLKNRTLGVPGRSNWSIDHILLEKLDDLQSYHKWSISPYQDWWQQSGGLINKYPAPQMFILIGKCLTCYLWTFLFFFFAHIDHMYRSEIHVSYIHLWFTVHVGPTMLGTEWNKNQKPPMGALAEIKLPSLKLT